MKKPGFNRTRLLSDTITTLKNAEQDWKEGWSNPLIRDDLIAARSRYLDEYHELSKSRSVKKSANSNSKPISKKE